MKKFFTLIAAVAMAASMNAQTAKVFTENTFLQTSQANVQAGIAEGWILEGSGKTAANGKKGSIDPQTKEEKGEGAVKLDGIGLKKDNSAKAFTMAIAGRCARRGNTKHNGLNHQKQEFCSIIGKTKHQNRTEGLPMVCCYLYHRSICLC